jgi:hypothetical protein
MKRTSLLTSVAAVLALAAGPAMANDAYIDQVQDNNTASIDQSGSSARAGTSSDPILQDGNFNVLDIDQSGNADAGTATNPNNRTGETQSGIEQRGDRNELTINQNQGQVFQVLQDATAAAGTESVTNKATINQSATNTNIVKGVIQIFDGEGDANVVEIDQNCGAGCTGNRVGIGTFNPQGGGVYQEGNSNTMDIDQVGAFNDVDWATQIGEGNDATIDQDGGRGNRVRNLEQTGDGNYANISLAGSWNGYDSFTPDTDAGDVGLRSGTVIQGGVDGGNGNFADLETVGDRNQYAFNQSGNNNSITGVQTGNNNEVAIQQTGGGIADFSQVGNGNNLGINQ